MPGYFTLVNCALMITLVLTCGAMLLRSYVLARASATAQLLIEQNDRARGRVHNPPTTTWQLGEGNSYCSFISHYKNEAGTSARYLRDLIQAMCGVPAFLDSADLNDLRLLFSEGLHKCDTMVALATHDYLTRPYCLLELYEAHKQRVPVVVCPIAGSGYDAQHARE